MEQAAAVVLAVIVFGVFLTYPVMGLYWGVRRYHHRHGISIFDDPGQAYLSITFWGLLWPLAFISEGYRDPELCRHPDCLYKRQEARRESERYEEALREEGREG